MPSDHQTVRIDILTCHSDPRGAVFEPLSGDDLPRFRNVHVVVSEPGAVRGNHAHVRGMEITSVYGPMLVRFREGSDVRDVNVPAGEAWRFCFPPGVPHAFRNTGNALAIIASFNTEEHDRDLPDVIRETLI